MSVQPYGNSTNGFSRFGLGLEFGAVSLLGREGGGSLGESWGSGDLCVWLLEGEESARCHSQVGQESSPLYLFFL